MSIRSYLLFNLKTYFLCIILDNKNLKFKDLSDDIAFDIWFFWNFASMEDLRRYCNLMVDFSKFTSNKKILSEVVVLTINVML